jgi:hypothetical protein
LRIVRALSFERSCWYAMAYPTGEGRDRGRRPLAQEGFEQQSGDEPRRKDH